MDNMAYLQQIATSGKDAKKAPKKGGDILSKIFTLRNGIIAAVMVVLIIITVAIVNALNVVDTKNQDLLVQSWYRSTYLKETLETYTRQVKSSDLRSLASSLDGTLSSIILNDGKALLDEYGVEVDDLDESQLATDEKSTVDTLNATLENSRLNGVLDRTFVREFTMQIAYLIGYQSECAVRSEEHPAIVEVVKKDEANLQNLYEQFKAYQDLSN